LGDYDRSGYVDRDDFVFWKAHYGETGTPGSGADGNFDGIVGAADYTVWRNNLGAGVPPGAASGAAVLPSSIVAMQVRQAAAQEPTEQSSLPTETDAAFRRAAGFARFEAPSASPDLVWRSRSRSRFPAARFDGNDLLLVAMDRVGRSGKQHVSENEVRGSAPDQAPEHGARTRLGDELPGEALAPFLARGRGSHRG
jgi:hypothetical protein